MGFGAFGRARRSSSYLGLQKTRHGKAAFSSTNSEVGESEDTTPEPEVQTLKTEVL